MDNFEDELKLGFIEEATDLLAKAEESFLRLDNERDNKALFDEIFRIAHNLKGTSKAVGFGQLSEFTHAAENLILKLKDGSVKVTDAVVSVLLDFKDQVQLMVQGLKSDLNARFDYSSILKKLEQATRGELADATMEIVGELQVPDRKSNAFMDDEPEKSSTTQAAEMMPTPTMELVNEAEKPVATKSQPVPAAGSDDESIRVKLSRIDLLTNLVGELVILQTVLDQRRFLHIQDDIANKSISQMAKLFKEAQEVTMSLRMLALKPTFQRMSRIVRDTSKVLGKNARLVTYGEEAEVDKTVLEHLSDPLVHIVRNAVDHGLETPEERRAKGKPAEGTVTLKAFHEGSHLVIEISDDGKGIDPEFLRKKAIAKGIIQETGHYTREQLLNLIFHAGFSTKEQVSEVSGRGVGMDVVKTNIQVLGGEVFLESEVGQGSTIRIVLPLTLAIVDGLVLKAQNEKFVIPLTQVFEIHREKRQRFTSVTGGGLFFELRGEVLPVFNLNAKLGVPFTAKPDEVVIVVRSGRYPYGVIVDDVINQQQIVIKRLGEDISGKHGFMGSAILGDGRPAFILDLIELYKGEMSEGKGFAKLVAANA